jgi:hypothetical protein
MISCLEDKEIAYHSGSCTGCPGSMSSFDFGTGLSLTCLCPLPCTLTSFCTVTPGVGSWVLQPSPLPVTFSQQQGLGLRRNAQSVSLPHIWKGGNLLGMHCTIPSHPQLSTPQVPLCGGAFLSTSSRYDVEKAEHGDLSWEIPKPVSKRGVKSSGFFLKTSTSPHILLYLLGLGPDKPIVS